MLNFAAGTGAGNPAEEDHDPSHSHICPGPVLDSAEPSRGHPALIQPIGPSYRTTLDERAGLDDVCAVCEKKGSPVLGLGFALLESSPKYPKSADREKIGH